MILTAEAKSIPLAHEMARQSGNNRYIIARKGEKLYMKNVLSVAVQSITTLRKQQLFIAADEAASMKDKQVLIIDDVISTGESLAALEKLVAQSGGRVAGKMAVLAEGAAKNRDDIITLGYLPLLDKNGNAQSV